MKLNNTTLKTMAILKLISRRQNGVTLKEIVDELKIPKSSAYDILMTLKSEGYIKYLDDMKRNYGIGVKLFIIGSSYVQSDDLINTSRSYAKKLGDKLGRTVFLGKESHGKIVYLYKYEPDNAIITTSNIGSEVDLYNTSLGKVILSYADNAKELIKDITFKKYTENTISNKTDLIKQLQKVKLNGYAVDDREIEEHLSCVGAPIFDHTKKIIAAISVSGLHTENLDIEYISRNVKETAFKISRQLGYNE